MQLSPAWPGPIRPQLENDMEEKIESAPYYQQ